MWQNIKTAVLLALLDGIFLAIGYAIGRGSGVIFAAILALVMNGITYWKSDKLAIAAAIIQFAISRSREYEADASGARLSRDPLALANALRKLELRTQQVPMQVAPAIAPLYIVNPFGNRRVSFAGLFSTHPPLEDRIARLERMAIAG